MELPLSTLLTPQLIVLEEAASTNDELLARASAGLLPQFSAVVTMNQTAGRGRLGRAWVAPPGQTLAVSVLLRPVLPDGEPLGLEHYGWIPLIAGIAMARVVDGLVVGHTVALKWPNDVLIDGRKVSGLLAELLPGRDGAVVGAGLNLTVPEADLPTPTATSLTLNGVTLAGDELAGDELAGDELAGDELAGDELAGDELAGDKLIDAALAAYLRSLKQLYSEFLRHGADPDASGIRQQLVALCTTLGRPVRAQLPGGEELIGTAVGIDESGQLLIRMDTDGRVQAVAAGDITHLR